MDRQDSEEIAMHALDTLGAVVKKEAVAALHAEEFERSRELTRLMEELVGLRQRILRAVGGRLVTNATVQRELHAMVTVAGDDFPRYFLRGGVLVKHGERRGGEGIYEQKIPRETYDEIIDVLRGVKRAKDAFRAPEVLAQASCPDYQVYLVLGLLQKAEYLESPQRGLYRFARRDEAPWAGSVWENLPEESQTGR